MEQPPDFVTQGESSNMVCKLRQALYGLKQSHRAWFGKFSMVIQEFGMVRNEVDQSVSKSLLYSKFVYILRGLR